MKQIIRLTESDLHRIVKESVKKIIKEANIVGKIPNFNPNRSYTKLDGVYADNQRIMDVAKKKLISIISKPFKLGVNNYDADAYIKSFNGQNFSATDYVFPAKDDTGNMTYVSHTLEAKTPITGSFSFTLGNKQCCLIITLYHSNGSTNVSIPLNPEQETNSIYTLQGVRVDNPQKGIVREYTASVRHVSKLPLAEFK